MTYNKNNNGRKEAIEKVKVIVQRFYKENNRAINVVFDGLNELIRAWGYDPREIIKELESDGYKIVPGRSKTGVGYIKIFPPGTLLNRNARDLEKYLK